MFHNFLIPKEAILALATDNTLYFRPVRFQSLKRFCSSKFSLLLINCRQLAPGNARLIKYPHHYKQTWQWVTTCITPHKPIHHRSPVKSSLYILPGLLESAWGYDYKVHFLESQSISPVITLSKLPLHSQVSKEVCLCWDVFLWKALRLPTCRLTMELQTCHRAWACVEWGFRQS